MCTSHGKIRIHLNCSCGFDKEWIDLQPCRKCEKRDVGGKKKHLLTYQAQMAELVDALDSKSGFRKGVQVRFLFWARVTAGSFEPAFSLLNI
jgi:hypothetical protein